MKQLTYRATVDGQALVIRFATSGSEFATDDPTDALVDDPPRCAGAAGAHAWCAVVAAWRRREDRSQRWQRDVVRDVVGAARRRFAAASDAQQRIPIHVFQAEATRAAERHYPPPPVADAPPPTLPPSLRDAVLHTPSGPRRDRFGA
ncbi:hypothetical protein [Patulibacter minatonensis]|uniref:hypothetical protein n=1 Tax=Patulibacter minatonensis TaxID=298163 RepID=UPI00047DA4E5|nr:hypothetical protein [Patulibacter minatonensis]